MCFRFGGFSIPRISWILFSIWARNVSEQGKAQPHSFPFRFWNILPLWSIVLLHKAQMCYKTKLLYNFKIKRVSSFDLDRSDCIFNILTKCVCSKTYLLCNVCLKNLLALCENIYIKIDITSIDNLCNKIKFVYSSCSFLRHF